MKASSKLVLLLVAVATLSLTTLKMNSSSNQSAAKPSGIAPHTANRSLSDMLHEVRYQMNHLTEGFSAYSGCPHRTVFPK